MTEEQKKLADSYNWWHRIKLTEDYTTKGSCPHGNESDFESRFGLPKDMTGLSVLDVGTWDGLFAFEAEKRGAEVDAIDCYQKCAGQQLEMLKAHEPFRLAYSVLNSGVVFGFNTLEDYEPTLFIDDDYPRDEYIKYDYIFHFGIMYHIKNPLGHVEKLMELVAPGGTILVETAISKMFGPVLEYAPGFDNDPTNFFYPTVEWMELAFKENGAKSVECFYNDGIRATFRIKC
jgi:tRNA (mo5U34)-methyltransferase